LLTAQFKTTLQLLEPAAIVHDVGEAVSVPLGTAWHAPALAFQLDPEAQLAPTVT
jgi:hypothetical protein